MDCARLPCGTRWPSVVDDRGGSRSGISAVLFYSHLSMRDDNDADEDGDGGSIMGEYHDYVDSVLPSRTRTSLWLCNGWAIQLRSPQPR